MPFVSDKVVHKSSESGGHDIIVNHFDDEHQFLSIHVLIDQQVVYKRQKMFQLWVEQIIPRGNGKGLFTCSQDSRLPYLQHGQFWSAAWQIWFTDLDGKE